MAINSPSYRYSINRYPGDGITVQWDISFAGGFIDRSHVKATVTDPVGNVAERAIQWVTDSTVIISPPVPDGHELRVFRDTPKDEPLSDFQDGAVINERNLDRNAQQSVFIAAEALDRGEGALSEISPRAILVPVGEVAPGFPPRDQLRGKLLGVSVEGKIIPVNPGGTGIGTIDTSMVEHEAGTLADYIAELNTERSLTADEIAGQAAAITLQGQQLVDQALADDDLDTRLTALRNEHDSLVTVVDALDQFATEEGVITAIQNEAATRQSADSAMAADIALIGAKTPEGTAFMLNLDTVEVDTDETLADRFAFISATTDTLEVQIEDETSARIAGDAAEATARASLAASMQSDLAAAVSTEAAARVSGDLAEATARDDLAATLRGETAAAVQNEATARANGDAAEAAQRAALATTLRDEAAALVSTEASARAAGDAAEAAARTTLATTLGNSITAQVQSEATARANADGAITTTLNLIGATANGGASFQLDMNKVLVDGGVSFASRISGLNSSIGNLSASISSEASTRANADTALSNSISTINASLGGYSASINSLSSVQANHTGYITTLQAKWSLTLDVNGYVSGLESVNNGTQSVITLRADKFRVGTSGGAVTYPFEIVSGVTYIKQAVIKEATIDTLRLADGAATAPASAVRATSYNTTTKGSWITLVTLTKSCAGFPVLLQGRLSAWVRMPSGSGFANGPVHVRLRRGSTVLLEHAEAKAALATSDPDNDPWARYQRMHFDLSLMTTPPAGAQTFTLQVYLAPEGIWGLPAGSELRVDPDAMIMFTEFKR